MNEAIAKSQALIEALAYIRGFRGRTVVVKLGGSLMETDTSQRELLTDVAFMATVGIRPVLVHGGGKRISAAMERSGIEPQFVQGRRYTDERTLKIVEHVLAGEINRDIVDSLNDLGCSAMGLHSLSSCVLQAEQIRLDGPEGRKIDIGLVGNVTLVNAKLIEALCQAGTIPVIAPIALDRNGGKLNINADTAAGMVAAAIKAEKLVMMSDTHGIRRDKNDPASRISAAGEKEIEQMVAQGVIEGGMLPKVEACLTALKAGVGRTHIIDGSFPHALLLEIYTDEGIGTLITKEKQ
ncbi:MAG: acetylglutamate kinase [Sedimentisphaerales bacterium]|nr:acetylglutamate kinase [Sedimentisphaerales bacterium]